MKLNFIYSLTSSSLKSRAEIIDKSNASAHEISIKNQKWRSIFRLVNAKALHLEYPRLFYGKEQTAALVWSHHSTGLGQK